jgi:Plasmid encoded RepA protein
MFQTQLRCLSTATIRLAIHSGADVSQIDTRIVTGFVNLWFPKDQRQRVLWNPSVRLSQEYFKSLKRHAVPLNERDIAALAHTALGLDIYAWLAQRLHRINPRKPAFIPWTALKDQFGPDYQRMDKFKAVFRVALDQVLSRYKAARIELDGRGMTGRNSPPPVPKRLFLVSNTKS